MYKLREIFMFWIAQMLRQSARKLNQKINDLLAYRCDVYDAIMLARQQDQAHGQSYEDLLQMRYLLDLEIRSLRTRISRRYRLALKIEGRVHF